MTMVKRFGTVVIAAAIVSAPAAAAAYLPVGPQQNVALPTVLSGGWSLCYRQTMSVGLGSSALDELAACGAPGRNVMLAGRQTGSETLLLLAQAPYADVTFATGAAANGITHTANGSEWYYSDDWSWGYAQAGAAVDKNQCDTNAGPLRMCVHTLATNVGGYRIGDNLDLNESTDFEKLIFVADSAPPMPEPASWAMLLAGFGLLGIATRRRQLAFTRPLRSSLPQPTRGPRIAAERAFSTT
jgi:hypothetical protein